MEKSIHKQNSRPYFLHKYTTDELLSSKPLKDSIDDVRNNY